MGSVRGVIFFAAVHMTDLKPAQYYQRLFCWFVPVELEHEVETRLRARRTVVFGLAMMFWAPVFAPIYQGLGSPRGALVIILTAVGIGVSMLSMRWTKSAALSGNLIAATVYACLVLLASFSGGIQSASLWWLAAVPIIGLLLGGVASGAIWTALSSIACIAFFALAWNGISVPNDIAVKDQAVLDCAAMCGIIVCAATLTLTFKVGEAAARRDLEVARSVSEQASRAKSEFLANMSHELRTPMNGILGLTELVLDGPLEGEQRDFLNSVHESGDNLLAILDEILDFSKIEAGKLALECRPFDLYETLGDALKPFGMRAHRKGLELTCHIDRDVPQFVSGDSVRLRQIVTNLVANALKFTEAGEVVVKVTCQSVDEEKVTMHLSVTDTGIGIPPEIQAIIFRAFEQADTSTTRRFGGTGLGLAICSQLVSLMQGQIDLESEVGGGSTFHLTVPFTVADGPSPHPRAMDLARFRDVRVLIVDDNASSRRSLEEILGNWEMQSDSTSDGPSALEMVRKAAAAGTPYRLVLIDSQMPEADGFEVAAQVQQQNPLGKIIMMLTSEDQRGDIDRCHSLAVATCLFKPLKQSEILESFAEILRYDVQETVRDVLDRPVRAARCDQLRVLLAEDSLVNQKLMVGLLERHGATVQVASNGREAVAACQSAEFDLVLMDVQMPEMDGLEATAEIRRRERGTAKHLPIIAVTAHAIPGDRQRCLKAGMDEYVAKPVRAEEFLDTIELVLRGAFRQSPDGEPGIGAEPCVEGEPAAIDWQETLQCVQGDRQILDTLIEAVLEEAPAMLQAVRRAVRDLDAKSLRVAAHTLKGAVRYFGARAVFDQAFALEQMGRDGTLEGAEPLVESLSRDLEQVLKELGEYANRDREK